MSAMLTTPSSAAVLAKGIATLERLLDSEDERVALKAAELLLRLHPDVPRRKAAAGNVREVEVPAKPDLSPPAPRAESNTARGAGGDTPTAKTLLLAPFNTPPSAPRSDPLPAPFLDGTRPLPSFLGSPKAASKP